MDTMSRTGVSTRPESAPAAAPTYRPPDPAPAIAPEADPFEVELREVARRLRKSVPNLTPRERDFLDDLARTEIRYPMPTVRKICRLSRRSTDPAAREGFAELIRADSLPADALSLTAAFDLETPAPGEADPLQRALEQNPMCPTAWRRCRDALARQLVATRRALDAVLQMGWRSAV